jgi:hypothetical protein
MCNKMNLQVYHLAIGSSDRKSADFEMSKFERKLWGTATVIQSKVFDMKYSLFFKDPQFVCFVEIVV